MIRGFSLPNPIIQPLHRKSPLKKIAYGIYGDLIIIPKAIFYLLKGDYHVVMIGS